MKKVLLFFAALAFAFSAMATEQTFDFSAQGYTNAQSFDGETIDLGGGVTAAWSKGTGSTNPAYYNTGTAIRLYGSNTVTFASANGAITQIVCTYSSSSYAGTISADCGSYSLSSTTGTWTGNSSTVVLTNTATSGHARLKKVVITYSGTDVNTTAIELNQTTLSMEQYREASLVATVTPSNSTQGVTWTSNNTDVATVEDGVVTAVAVGNATITATSGSYNASCAVTVSAATPITCAQAAEFAATVSGNNVPYAGGKYVIQGYVTEIATAYSSQYDNISVWMADAVNGGNVFQAFRVKPVTTEDQAIEVGQQVEVIAQITKYTNTSTVYETISGGSIRITNSIVDPDVVAAPVFDVEGGAYFSAQTITITQADGKQIYYTLDGTDPTTNEEAVLYTTPITIEEGGVIKAAAKDGNTWSSVVTQTYTFPTAYANIAALKNAITATAVADAVDMYVTLTDAVVTYINGSNYYIQDASAGILIYNNTQTVSSVLTAAGVKLNGTMKCAGYIYNGLYELTKSFDFTNVTATPGATIPCTEVTIAQLNANIAQYESMRVKVVEATVSSALASRKATIAVDTDNIQIYEKVSGNLSSTALATANKVVNVIGYPGVNNSTNQLNVWVAADVTEVESETPVTIAAPVISPASCNFQSSIEVTITVAEGNVIAYTLNGESPIENENAIFTTTNTVTLTLTETTTLKAATWDGGSNFSEASEATFTQSNDQVVTIGSFPALSGALNADLSYASYKGNASTAPFLSNNCIRLYQNGGYISITGVRGVKIHSVKVTSSASYNSTTVGIAVDGGAAPTTGETLAASSSYTFSGLNNDSVALYCLGTDKNTRLEIAALEVSYVKEEQTITALTLSGEYETSFSINGDFNHDGVVVTATYEDGETEVVTDNATFSTPDLSSLGEKTVTVSFGGASTTYTIQVIPAAVSGIAITGEYQTIFALGDAFNHDGLIVTATYTDNTTADVTEDATFSTPDMSTTGVKTITITYGDKTANYTITVKAAAGSMAYELVDFTAISPYKDLTSNQNADMTTYSGASFDMLFSKGTSSSAPKYYQNGDAVRAYAGNTLKITAIDEIKRIDFLWVNGYVDDAVAITTSADTMVVTFSDKCRFTGVAVMYVNHTYAYYKATEDVAAGNENALLAQLNGIVASILTENDDVTYVITEDMTTGSQVRRQANMTVSADELTINVINPEIANEAQTAPEEGNRVIVYDGTTSATGVIGAKINSLDAKGWATSVENTAAEGIQKVMRDGKVIIIKNGVEYSVMGQKL